MTEFSLTAYSTEIRPKKAWITVDDVLLYKREVDTRIKKLEAECNDLREVGFAYRDRMREQIDKVKELEAQLAEADKFGMQNRQLVSDNLALKAERDRLREAIKIQALKTAYYNGHGKSNSIDLTQRYPTGELLYERYLCDEAKKALEESDK